MEVARMCCVCRTRSNRGNLVRVARIDGKFVVGGVNGRGCHVCRDCIDKCIKTRALNRSFKTNVPNDVYTEIDKLRTPQN